MEFILYMIAGGLCVVFGFVAVITYYTARGGRL